MSFSNYYANHIRRQNRMEFQSFKAHRSYLYEYHPTDGVNMKGRLASGINSFKYVAPYPSGYLGVTTVGTQERSLEDINFFPKNINFLDITTTPFPTITSGDPVGPNAANYQYRESYFEPWYNNQYQRKNIAYKFENFDPDEFTLAIRKDPAENLQLKIPSSLGGIVIDNTDVPNLCYVQKDYPLSTLTNTGDINKFRVKLVKVTSIATLPLLDPDRVDDMESLLTFPIDDYHPSNFFQLIYVTNPANPWINNWQTYNNKQDTVDALNLAGVLLLDDFITVTRVPDLYPQYQQAPPPNQYPPQHLIGCAESFATDYQVKYQAFPAGPVNRSFFYGGNNLGSTNTSFNMFNPQIGEMTVTKMKGNTDADFTSAQGYVPNTAMQYYYDNKLCPLHEIGASGVQDFAYWNIWLPAGITTSRYLYQNDWNGLTVSSGHFIDYTVSAGCKFYGISIPDAQAPTAQIMYNNYFWKPTFVMESPDTVGRDMPIPQSNWILPCNDKAVTADANRFDAFRTGLPTQAKAENFTWRWIKNAGGTGIKFVFLENRATTSATYTHTKNPFSGGIVDAVPVCGWSDPEAQSWGNNLTTPNRKYTLSANNPQTRGLNPTGGRDGSGGGTNNTMAIVLRRRVFFNPDSGWPYVQGPTFPGDASTTVNTQGGEVFSIAYMGYKPFQRLSMGVVLFDVYSVDDERNLQAIDLGNQFTIIGTAYAGFQGTREPDVYNFHIGRKAGVPVNDPPSDYYFKYDGTIILQDRLGRPAPYMKVNLVLPDTPYWQMYVSTDISLPPISRWQSGTVVLTADANGSIPDLWFYPLLKNGGLESINEDTPSVRVYLKASDNCEYSTGNAIIKPPPGPNPGPGAQEAGHVFLFQPTGIKAGVLNQNNAATIPNFITNGCSGPMAAAHNVISPGAGGIRFIDSTFFVPIAATQGGLIKDGHNVQVNLNGFFGGGFSAYFGAKSGNTGIADAELAIAGPTNVRTQDGGVSIRVVVDSNVAAASGGFSVVLQNYAGVSLATPYNITIYSVCP